MSRAKMGNFVSTDLYGLTDRAHSCGRSNLQVVKQMVAAGIKVIQYREKDLPMKEKYEECLAILAVTRQANATLIVNDHVDLAMLAGADGVHVGQDDLPPAEIRKLVGEEMIIGLSTHSPEQAEAAVRQGIVDYIGVGPIFPTHTKRNVCAPVGLAYLDYVAKNISLPFVAIGGIKEHNIGDVRRHGARLVAVVTGITSAEDIALEIKTLRQKPDGMDAAH